VIVRILGEGQFDVPASCEARLEELDQQLVAAVDAGDSDRFAEALSAVLAEVRSSCKPLSPEEIHPSDMVLPDADASLEEVREMLKGQGLLADTEPQTQGGAA
jgi:hypothetical protein